MPRADPSPEGNNLHGTFYPVSRNVLSDCPRDWPSDRTRFVGYMNKEPADRVPRLVRSSCDLHSGPDKTPIQAPDHRPELINRDWSTTGPRTAGFPFFMFPTRRSVEYSVISSTSERRDQHPTTSWMATSFCIEGFVGVRIAFRKAERSFVSMKHPNVSSERDEES
jgi:hypothetical protein